MRRATILVTMALAALTGIAVGAVAATTGSPGSTTGGGAPAVTVGTPFPVDSVRQPTRGPERIAVRVADPRGGPEWAVRTFEARQVDNDVGWAPGEPRPKLHYSWHRCAQLGRVLDGTFGWIRPGETTLHPLARDTSWLTVCERPDTRRAGTYDLETLVSGAFGPAPRLEGTVAWGLLPAGTADGTAVIEASSGTSTPARGGAVLALGPSFAHKWDLAVRAGGRTTHPMDNGRGESRADARDMRVVARAADPAGGAPLGIAARTTHDGRLCVSDVADLVQGRVGQLVAQVGFFSAPNGCPPQMVPTRSDPFYALGGTASSGDEDPAAAAAARASARIRRTQPGRTTLGGPVPKDVVRVEIRTPRDVRTLRPGRGHAILAVWDGTFASGAQATLTATFADGTTVTKHRPIGF